MKRATILCLAILFLIPTLGIAVIGPPNIDQSIKVIQSEVDRLVARLAMLEGELKRQVDINAKLRDELDRRIAGENIGDVQEVIHDLWATKPFGDEAALSAAATEYDVRRAIDLRQHEFDLNSDGLLDEDWQEKITSVIDAYPADFDGLIVPDWETPLFKVLKYGTEDEMNAIIDRYIEVALFIKSLRPKAIVGPYGLPDRGWWAVVNGKEDWWESRWPVIERLWTSGAFDVLCPSAYDFYSPDHDGTSDAKAAWTRQTELWIDAADGRPVIPFVMGMYHDRGTPAFVEIPLVEMLDQLTAMASAEVDGDRIDGFAHWSFWRVMWRGERFGTGNERFGAAWPGLDTSGTEYDYPRERWPEEFRVMREAMGVQK